MLALRLSSTVVCRSACILLLSSLNGKGRLYPAADKKDDRHRLDELSNGSREAAAELLPDLSESHLVPLLLGFLLRLSIRKLLPYLVVLLAVEWILISDDGPEHQHHCRRAANEKS